ncbi:MAG: GNAT family N-acetyltransferase [Luteimonas sp.]
MNGGIVIREIGAGAFDRLWPIFADVVAQGETYAYASDLSLDQARRMWTSPPARCFAAEADGAVLGGYRLAPNVGGPGAHVANGSYMVACAARGRGVGALLCEHSLDEARRAGFLAMQFNLVVSTNAAAVRLWQRHGFAIVGTLPGAFRHARHGLVDAYVMYRTL